MLSPITKANKSFRPLLISACLLLTGFFILVASIDFIHMQADETLTYVTTQRSFLDTVDFTLFHDVHAPLWFILAWAWQQVAGIGEFAGRFQSVLIAMLTLSVVYQIGRDGFKKREFGWFAIALLSTNAFFLVYSLEIRPYPLVMLAAALSYRFFLAWLERKTWSLALFYGLSLSLLLYTHYYLAFVLLSQVIYFLLFKILDWKLLFQGLIVGLLGALLLIPQIIVLLYQLRFVSFTQGGTQGVPTSATNAETISELLALASNGWIILAIALAVLGLIFLWRKPTYRLSLFWFLVAPSLLILANLRTPLLTTRYISYAAPALSLVTGFALAGLIAQKSPKWRNISVWTALFILCGLNLYNLPNYIPVRIPFRDIFGEISNLSQSGDVLYVLHKRSDNFLDEQLSRYLPPELLANQVDSIESAQSKRRVWFLTNAIFEDSYQETFAALESNHRVQAVFGNCSSDWCYIAQLMLAPPLSEAIFFEETLGFLGADIEPISDNRLGVLLWWMVETTPQADYSISLQLLAADGSLVSQVDRPIDPPEAEISEIPSSAMQPQNSYIDWRLLELPANLAVGDYQLHLVVYQWQNGQRLTLNDGSDSLLIETIQITGEE